MEHVLEREDRQEELTKEIKSIVKEIENDDLKVVTFMEYTSPPKEIKPKVIKFNKALELLRLIAKQGKIQKGRCKNHVLQSRYRKIKRINSNNDGWFSIH
jgi:gentisate 1,2-dioxygenase